MTILVPIDFSPRSINALEFAAAMASSNNGALYLVYVLSPEPANEYHEPKQPQFILSELDELRKKLARVFGVQSAFEVGKGAVPEEILRIASIIQPDIIVMASRGRSTLSTRVLGSNTSRVIEESAIPVLAVPFGCKYASPSRIVFGTENEHTDIRRLQAFIDFANLSNAQIEVVHVVNRFGDQEEGSGVDKVEQFRNGLRQSISYPFIHCEEYQHTDPAEGMLCFVEEQHADLLVLSSEYRPLIERLVRGNLNNEWAYQLEVPLLCINDSTPSSSNAEYATNIFR
jgi:nucleotide-binding universal stress UspA family protein